MAKGAKLRVPGAGGARRVSVRPVRGEAERARWDALMRDHHYLGFRGMIGNSLRHVAERSDGAWVALLGWRAGAHKLAARDKWIGWTAEQRSRRLHLIANNVRFVILPGCSEPNLASRVLGRSLRRLSERHARGARASGAAGGDVRGSGAVRGDQLPGGQLGGGGAVEGLRAGIGRGLPGARPAEDDPGPGVCRGTPARRCAVGRTIRRGAAPRRSRRRRLSSRFGCAACTTICGGCRTSARAAAGATSWRRCWRSPWRRSCAARRGWRRRPSSRNA